MKAEMCGSNGCYVFDSIFLMIPLSNFAGGCLFA